MSHLVRPPCSCKIWHCSGSSTWTRRLWRRVQGLQICGEDVRKHFLGVTLYTTFTNTGCRNRYLGIARGWELFFHNLISEICLKQLPTKPKNSLWPVTFFFNCHFLDLFALSFIDDTFFTLFLFCFERMHCIAGSRLILSVLFGRYIWRSELPKLGLRSDFFFYNLILV